MTKVLLATLTTAPLPPPSTAATASTDPSTSTTTILHLHNQLFTAILANVFYRDPPPEAVAAWVLSTDSPSAHGASKTSTGTGAGAGANNQIEERIKREVMGLSARDRRRIKAVKDSRPTTVATDTHVMGRYEDGLGLQEAVFYHDSLEPVVRSLSDSAAGGPSTTAAAAAAKAGSASALAKTNFDVEIKRRFAAQMASESLEFPARTEIQARLEPICYEQGLVGGIANPAIAQACAELIETAAETYIKEQLEAWFAIIRADSAGLVQTAQYKARLRREEALEEEQAAAAAAAAVTAAASSRATLASASTALTDTDPARHSEPPLLNGDSHAVSADAKHRVTATASQQQRQHHNPGDIIRNALGLLPVEAESVAAREPLALDELRLALQLDNNRLRLDPFLAQDILFNVWVDDPAPVNNVVVAPNAALASSSAPAPGPGPALAGAGSSSSSSLVSKKRPNPAALSTAGASASPHKAKIVKIDALGLNGTMTLSPERDAMVLDRGADDHDHDDANATATANANASVKANANSNSNSNANNVNDDYDKLDADDRNVDWGWAGGSVVHRGGLMDMLNGVLAVGS